MPITDQLSLAWPPDRWRDVGVVVGVSGGADSVALLVSLCELRGAMADRSPRGFVIAAHYHHAVRGETADADQVFVRDLAQRWGVGFETGRADRGSSDEASMRTARREFLVGTAKATGARYIALAHSADDNVETVLHHLFRGTGPSGIAGMPITRPIDDDLVLVRPMLNVGAEEIRDHLRAIGQSWREDESNADTTYGRNWLRHELIPMIRSRYPSARDAIGRAAEASADWRGVIEGIATDWIESHVASVSPVTIRVDGDAEPAIVIAALQKIWDDQRWPRGDMTRDHWQSVARAVIGHPSQPQSLPGKVQLIVDGDIVMLFRMHSNIV